MSFYKDLSGYYERIFPVEYETLEFLLNTTVKMPSRVLDIACGDAGYAIEIAKRGHEVYASDLDEAMVEKAKAKAAQTGVNINIFQADMLNIHSVLKYINRYYDLVSCIGNSLVHLDSTDEVSIFLNAAEKLLSPEGSLVLQIINYDRILDKDVKELPLHTDDSIDMVFERRYRRIQGDRHILFETTLKAEGHVWENTVRLIPLRMEKLVDLLKQAGFNNIKVTGDFTDSAYEQYSSYMTVIRARI